MSSPARICRASMLLFASQYMLIPVLPVVLAAQTGMSFMYAGLFMLVLTTGMLLVGPFHSYLVDAFRRKYIGVLSLFVLALVSVGHFFSNHVVESLLLLLVQGMALGLAYLSLTTICIDVTPTGDRDRVNKKLGWFVHLGILLGAASGCFLYQNYGAENGGFYPVILVSVGLTILATMTLIAVHVPFRAPIGVPVCSLDRFYLPSTWALTLNTILVAFVPGIFLPMIYWELRDVFSVNGSVIPYFTIAGLSFLLLMIFKRIIRKIEHWKLVTSGLVLMVIAISLFILLNGILGRTVSAVLLGMGTGCVSLTFLCMFVNLSSHCQRAAANNSYLIAWQLGISAGIAVACYLRVDKLFTLTFQLAMFAAAGALTLFLLVTFPYYRRKK